MLRVCYAGTGISRVWSIMNHLQPWRQGPRGCAHVRGWGRTGEGRGTRGDEGGGGVGGRQKSGGTIEKVTDWLRATCNHEKNIGNWFLFIPFFSSPSGSYYRLFLSFFWRDLNEGSYCMVQVGRLWRRFRFC